MQQADEFGCVYDVISGVRTQRLRIDEQIEPGCYLRFGIRNRTQINTTILPYLYPPFILLSSNIKVSLFDIGSDPLFRNISLALYAGGDIMPFEWDRYNNLWGGLIIGTHCPVCNNDLEFVFMLSGSYFSLYTTSDGLGDKDISYATTNFQVVYLGRQKRDSWK